MYSIYTVSHKNRATLFSIITPAFLGQFFYIFFGPVETERNLYNVFIQRLDDVINASHCTSPKLLILKIKYVEFEDRPKYFYQKPVGM